MNICKRRKNAEVSKANVSFVSVSFTLLYIHKTQSSMFAWRKDLKKVSSFFFSSFILFYLVTLYISRIRFVYFVLPISLSSRSLFFLLVIKWWDKYTHKYMKKKSELFVFFCVYVYVTNEGDNSTNITSRLN